MSGAMLNRVCPLCEHGDAARLWRKGALQLVRCCRCSMIYANPVESDLATGAFYDQRASSFYLSPDKLQSDYAPVRFEREIRIFRAFCLAGRILDVGCSTGGFLLSLRRQYPGDYSVFGTDVAGAALDYAEGQGVQIVQGPFLEFETGESSFDAVTFWAVIEHLADPKSFLDKAAVLLRPGGFCFILVPNMKSLAVRLLGSRYRYIMPDHVNYFTPETLKAFGRCGGRLEVVKMTSTHFNPVVIVKDWRSGAGRVPDSERAGLLKRTTAWKQSHWLRPAKVVYSAIERLLASFGLADNLVAVLRKKS